MLWVPRVVAPLFRALRFNRRLTKVVSRVGRIGRLRAVQYPVRKPTKLLKRHGVLKRAGKKSKPTGQIVGGMVYRRRKFAVRRRRYGRRRFRKTVNKIHTFVRWCDKDTTYGIYGPNTITETGATQHLTYQFKLDNVAGVSDFTNLYDGYKINKVQLFLEPQYDQAQGVGSAGPISKKIRVVHDYNDATPLSDEDEYLQYGNCKSYFPWSRYGIRITLYPKINNIVENVLGGANAFTSMNSNRQFINIASDELPHFGVKMMIPGGMLANETVAFRVRAKMWLSMRGTK